MDKYLEMTITQLKEEAKNRGMKGTSAMKKQELVELLSAADKMLAQKKAEKKAVAPAVSAEKASPVSEKVRPVRERPAQARPQGSQERPAISRPQGGQERPGLNRPQGSQERPTGMRPQGSQERPAMPRPQGNPERTMPSRPQTEQARPAEAVRPAQEGTTESAPQPAHRFDPEKASAEDIKRLDSGETRKGILEVMPDNFGFIRCDNFLPGDNDVYVSPSQIRKYGLKTGDIVCGNTKVRMQNEKFSALLYIKNVNGLPADVIAKRKRFEDLTPIFPNERIHLETPGCSLSMRMVDLISPIGKGQRGMIVSQPKTGKT
ncbi:MAG: Rho termination factor N-terminal domain-containing protein, partial [Lachnospiraceae bacterium]|nr:Rho termination factor N-terminal domain-containing protein [Lachnospiraceae bacterium]